MYCSTLHFPKVMSMFEDFSENISSIMHRQAISVWNSKLQLFRYYVNSFRLKNCGFVIYSRTLVISRLVMNRWLTVELGHSYMKIKYEIDKNYIVQYM